jgi:hypothetical protein
MLPAVKQNLDIYKFKDDCKMKMVMVQSLITEYKNLYQHGMEKLLPYYNKCLNPGGDCVNSSTIKTKYSHWR